MMVQQICLSVSMLMQEGKMQKGVSSILQPPIMHQFFSHDLRSTGVLRARDTLKSCWRHEGLA
jgi:hypothetical protein